LQSQIKIVKRQRNSVPLDSQTEIESKPVEQSAREITMWLRMDCELRNERVTTVIGNQGHEVKRVSLYWTLEDGKNLAQRVSGLRIGR